MRTVFHVSSPGSFELAEGKVRNLRADDTIDVTAVAVVVDDPETIDEIATGLAETASVVADDANLEVCLNALRGAKVGEKALPDGVETVSSGVGELTRLQHEGYAYIRI